MPGVIDASVWSNNYLAADRFHVRLAAAAGGLALVDVPEVRLEVQAGFQDGWTGLVVGEADSVSLNPVQGIVDVEGRDLSALLVDNRVNETFANRTSSEIAQELGGRHGLSVDATATETLVGRYYQSEHDRLTMGQFARTMSEWDLLAYLAGQEGFDLFMDGDTLRFGPRDASDVVTVDVSECTDARLDHSLMMERTIEVTVQSWDQRGAEAVVETVQGGGSGRNWKHSVVKPNLPAVEAERLAQRILSDLIRHQRHVTLSMPGELTINARRLVALSGSQTAWDGTYAVSEVHRQLDARRGFTQRVVLQVAV